MNITLPTPETDIVDTYTGVSLRVPAVPSQYAAAEVTTVRVSLTVAVEDSDEDELKAGDVLASVELIGYALTKAGKRDSRQGYRSLFGKAEDETRWEIARTALLASCERHGVDPAKIVDHSIAPFAEMQADKQARLLARFGIEG
jgi:hypothetical protein